MTILKSSQTRGFFDPITLGFFVDGDFEKLYKYKNDDIRLKTKSTLFHEITHYLQFYGTTFGNSYLFHQWTSLAEKLEFIRELQKTEEGLSTPLSRYRHKNPDEYTWVNMQSEKYYQQELYGATFRLFDYTPLITREGGPPLVSSPLIIGVSGSGAYAVVGETILENQAVANELVALAYDIKDSDVATKIITSYYEDLPDLAKYNYLIIGQVLAQYNLLHLEPILYFIALNQLQISKMAFRNSEYEMVRALKRIIESFPNFTKLNVPRDNDEVFNVVNSICETCDLHNPFDSLNAFIKLRQAEEISMGQAVSWASVKVMAWVSENPYEYIYWPKISNPMYNVPILNVRDENHNLFSYFSNTQPMIAKNYLIEHRTYSTLLHLVNSLLGKLKTKCPLFIQSKPSTCGSCEKCSGYIPDDEIKEDCPQYQALIAQGIDLMNIKREVAG